MAANERQNLLLRHHRLFDRFGLWHVHVFRRVFARNFCFFARLRDGSNVDEAVANHCLRVALRLPACSAKLEFQRCPVGSAEFSELRDQVVLESEGVDFPVCRAPSSLPHRDITLRDKPAKRHECRPGPIAGLVPATPVSFRIISRNICSAFHFGVLRPSGQMATLRCLRTSFPSWSSQ